jgi:threonine aldolase
MEINLISDTVTKPTNEMLQYMFNAEVGDDVYRQDPTVIVGNKNSRAIRYGSRSVFSVWNNGKSNGYKSKYTTRRALIADKYAHVYHYEGGGVSSIVVCLVVY